MSVTIHVLSYMYMYFTCLLHTIIHVHVLYCYLMSVTYYHTCTCTLLLPHVCYILSYMYFTVTSCLLHTIIHVLYCYLMSVTYYHTCTCTLLLPHVCYILSYMYSVLPLSCLYFFLDPIFFLHSPLLLFPPSLYSSSLPPFLPSSLSLVGEVFDYLVAHGRMKEREARIKFRQVHVQCMYNVIYM